jgi:hypothetical protein
VDNNDDEMLIIDCSSNFRVISSAMDLATYIKRYFNLDTPISSDTNTGVYNSFNWIKSQNETIQNQCYFILTKTKNKMTNGNIHYVYNVYFVYTPGIPYIEKNDEDIYIKSKLNNSNTWLAERCILYSTIVGDMQGWYPWITPNESDQEITSCHLQTTPSDTIIEVEDNTIAQFVQMKIKE